MTNLIATTLGVFFLTASDAFSAQFGSMMNGGNGGMWAGGTWLGGSVGISGIVLMLVTLIGLGVFVREKGKRTRSRRQRRP